MKSMMTKAIAVRCNIGWARPFMDDLWDGLGERICVVTTGGYIKNMAGKSGAR